MDITTPLRDDEVFTVQKHRVVPVAVTSSFTDVGEKEDEKKKKDKKDKKGGKGDKGDDGKDGKKSKKDKTKSKKLSDDLLLMDWNDPPVPSISMGYAPPTSASSDKKKDKDKEKDRGKEEKESKKTKKSSHVWMPLLSDKNVDLFYSSSVTDQVITITLKAVNTTKQGSSVNVTATMSSTALVRPTTPSN